MHNTVMRFVVLFALMFLFPAFAHALVNINTADIALLDTLPHIGEKLAQKIIDYRTENGPFTRVEDLQNVNGIGSGSNYADIAPLITVGDTDEPDIPDATASSTLQATASTTEAVATAPSSGGAPPEYIPIPTLRVVTGGSRTVSAGADTAFTAATYDGKGNKRDDALVMWSFGDGMRRNGASVYHAYYYPGEYIVVVHVTTPDGGDALVQSIITVKDASVKIASVSARGITLVNGSSRALDLSLWRLSAGGKEFKIPADTHILAGRTIVFPSQIIQLPLSTTASLLYPSGEVAVTYPSAPVEPVSSSDRQPLAPQTSFNTVQAVKSFTVNTVKPTIIATTTNTQTYGKAVIAPTATTELAAVGAIASTAPPASARKTGGIFRSPWFMSLIGVIALAGGAFIFL